MNKIKPAEAPMEPVIAFEAPTTVTDPVHTNHSVYVANGNSSTHDIHESSNNFMSFHNISYTISQARAFITMKRSAKVILNDVRYSSYNTLGSYGPLALHVVN